MKLKPTIILLVIIYLNLLILQVKAQEKYNPPEIKGSYSQIYQELEIEITDLQRMKEYQAYFPNSSQPRGKKIIADDGFEVAVVHLHTKRVGDKSGVSLYGICLLDSKGTKYEGNLKGAFIGTGSESRFDPKEHDYEFPVVIPKGVKLSAFQLWQPIHREIQPYIVIQKITFDISKMKFSH